MEREPSPGRTNHQSASESLGRDAFFSSTSSNGSHLEMEENDDPAVREGGDSEVEESKPIIGSELQAACRDAAVSLLTIRRLVTSDPESRDIPDSNLESPLQVYLKTCHGSNIDPNPEIVKQLATYRAVNMRSRSGKTALCVLGSMATHSFSLFRRAVMFFGEVGGREPDKANYFQTMDIILSNNPTASKSRFLNDLLYLPKDMRIHSFMNSNTRNAINGSMGRAPYSKRWLLVCFSNESEPIAISRTLAISKWLS